MPGLTRLTIHDLNGEDCWKALRLLLLSCWGPEWRRLFVAMAVSSSVCSQVTQLQPAWGQIWSAEPPAACRSLPCMASAGLLLSCSSAP